MVDIRQNQRFTSAMVVEPTPSLHFAIISLEALWRRIMWRPFGVFPNAWTPTLNTLWANGGRWCFLVNSLITGTTVTVYHEAILLRVSPETMGKRLVAQNFHPLSRTLMEKIIDRTTHLPWRPMISTLNLLWGFTGTVLLILDFLLLPDALDTFFCLDQGGVTTIAFTPVFLVWFWCVRMNLVRVLRNRWQKPNHRKINNG